MYFPASATHNPTVGYGWRDTRPSAPTWGTLPQRAIHPLLVPANHNPYLPFLRHAPALTPPSLPKPQPLKRSPSNSSASSLDCDDELPAVPSRPPSSPTPSSTSSISPPCTPPPTLKRLPTVLPKAPSLTWFDTSLSLLLSPSLANLTAPTCPDTFLRTTMDAARAEEFRRRHLTVTSNSSLRLASPPPADDADDADPAGSLSASGWEMVSTTLTLDPTASSSPGRGGCRICLEAFGGRETMKLPCGCGFHKDCILTWLSGSASAPSCYTNRCPTCNAILTSESPTHSPLTTSIPPWSFQTIGRSLASNPTDDDEGPENPAEEEEDDSVAELPRHVIALSRAWRGKAEERRRGFACVV